MSTPTTEELKGAVERLHGCRASYINEVAVVEMFGDKPVWEGVVHVYGLTGHLEADKCYAWASPIEGSKKYRYYAVLHIPSVDSPEKAVRASIVQDAKSDRLKA